jgi:hypothetical protein
MVMVFSGLFAGQRPADESNLLDRRLIERRRAPHRLGLCRDATRDRRQRRRTRVDPLPQLDFDTLARRLVGGPEPRPLETKAG